MGSYRLVIRHQCVRPPGGQVGRAGRRGGRGGTRHQSPVVSHQPRPLWPPPASLASSAGGEVLNHPNELPTILLLCNSYLDKTKLPEKTVWPVLGECGDQVELYTLSI